MEVGYGGRGILIDNGVGKASLVAHHLQRARHGAVDDGCCREGRGAVRVGYGRRCGY